MNVDAITTTSPAWAASAYARSRSKAELESTAPQGSTGIEDRVEFSRVGMMASLLNDLFGVAPGTDGEFHLEDFKSRLGEISAELESTLGSTF
jgi:hypothetical protein